MESPDGLQEKRKLILLKWRVVRYGSYREKHRMDCEGPSKQCLLVWLLIGVMKKVAYF